LSHQILIRNNKQHPKQILEVLHWKQCKTCVKHINRSSTSSSANLEAAALAAACPLSNCVVRSRTESRRCSFSSSAASLATTTLDGDSVSSSWSWKPVPFNVTSAVTPFIVLDSTRPRNFAVISALRLHHSHLSLPEQKSDLTPSFQKERGSSCKANCL
jgi:uncharacterized protein YfiM (DUF2279 family)